MFICTNIICHCDRRIAHLLHARRLSTDRPLTQWTGTPIIDSICTQPTCRPIYKLLPSRCHHQCLRFILTIFAAIYICVYVYVSTNDSAIERGFDPPRARYDSVVSKFDPHNVCMTNSLCLQSTNNSHSQLNTCKLIISCHMQIDPMGNVITPLYLSAH